VVVPRHAGGGPDSSLQEEADGDAGAVERRALAAARGEPPLHDIGVVHGLERGAMLRAWRRTAMVRTNGVNLVQ
jgi:hypothetical protein